MSRIGLRALVVLLTALSLPACGFETQDVNEGSACVFPQGTNADEDSVWSQGTLNYPGGGNFELLVGFDGCMSSSCDEFVDDYCDVRVEGQQIIIDAGGVIESRGRTCTDDCRTPTTSCMVEGLGEGNYEIVMGSRRGTLTLPSTTAQPYCAGEFP